MKKILLIIGLLLVTSSIRADEVVNLNTPIVPPSRTSLSIQTIIFDISAKSITITFTGNDGIQSTAFYPTTIPPVLNPLGMPQPSGATLLSTVNTANNTVNSMVKKIYQRLQADGYIAAGTITGTPN